MDDRGRYVVVSVLLGVSLIANPLYVGFVVPDHTHVYDTFSVDPTDSENVNDAFRVKAIGQGPYSAFNSTEVAAVLEEAAGPGTVTVPPSGPTRVIKSVGKSRYVISYGNGGVATNYTYYRVENMSENGTLRFDATRLSGPELLAEASIPRANASSDVRRVLNQTQVKTPEHIEEVVVDLGDRYVVVWKVGIIEYMGPLRPLSPLLTLVGIGFMIVGVHLYSTRNQDG